MAFIIFVSILFIGFCIILNCVVLKADNATKFHYYFTSCITTCCFLLLISIYVLKFDPTPSALDVYRGNTVLKITSVNGIPVDTVVVFKNK
jgi:hypothetical protein